MANKVITINQFVQTKVQPEFRSIVQKLRELMHKIVPEAAEVITYGILGWRIKNIIAVVSPTKKDITFAFSKGAGFEDKYKLLKGTGKVSKNIKIKNVNEIDESILEYYIKQAVKLDSE